MADEDWLNSYREKSNHENILSNYNKSLMVQKNRVNGKYFTDFIA
jgi:hypothetical protein